MYPQGPLKFSVELWVRRWYWSVSSEASVTFGLDTILLSGSSPSPFAFLIPVLTSVLKPFLNKPNFCLTLIGLGSLPAVSQDYLLFLRGGQ